MCTYNDFVCSLKRRSKLIDIPIKFVYFIESRDRKNIYLVVTLPINIWSSYIKRSLTKKYIELFIQENIIEGVSVNLTYLLPDILPKGSKNYKVINIFKNILDN